MEGLFFWTADHMGGEIIHIQAEYPSAVFIESRSPISREGGAKELLTKFIHSQ
jgi:hypothetical protein